MSHCEACVLVIFFSDSVIQSALDFYLKPLLQRRKNGSLVYFDAVPPFSVLALLALFPEFVLFGCGAALD